MNEPTMSPRHVPSYKKGGKVKKTGLAMVHKGERVIPAMMKEMKKDSGKVKGMSNRQKKIDKAARKNGF